MWFYRPEPLNVEQPHFISISIKLLLSNKKNLTFLPESPHVNH